MDVFNLLINNLGDIRAYFLLWMLLCIILIFFFTGFVLGNVWFITLLIPLIVITAQAIPIKINLLAEMGGTREYGRILLNSLYLVVFTSGLLPLFVILNGISKLSINLETNLTISALMHNSLDAFDNWIQNITIVNILDFSSLMILFAFYLILIVIAILGIHYNIKTSKLREMQKIEAQFNDIIEKDYKNVNHIDTSQYLFSLYDRISTVSTWPVKRGFIVEILISLVAFVIAITI